MPNEAAAPSAPDPGSPDARWSRSRIRRLAARAVLGTAILLTVLGASIIIACYIDDRTIVEARGEAVAEVVDTSLTRTVVRFSTEDGRVYIPPNGVLYPMGLQEGQTIQVEFDKRNPDLVRVAGRGAELSFLPVLSALAGAWVVLGLAHWYLRRSTESRK